MPKISTLYRYPIKSCAGRVWNGPMEIGERGPVWDRLFAVTDFEGNPRTQRREQGGFTKMALISPLIVGGTHIDLWAPDTDSLTIPIEIVGGPGFSRQATVFGDICKVIDQGTRGNTWFTQYLGVPCCLVRMADTCYRRVDPVFSPEAAQTSLNDGFPILLISEASLADLNSRLAVKGRAPVSRENFRAPFWVDDCEPYEEDTWDRIEINGIEFDVANPCRRCSITQVDPQRGEYREDNEPLITLRDYRFQTIKKNGQSGVMFGQNIVHRGTGIVQPGDEVHILKRK